LSTPDYRKVRRRRLLSNKRANRVVKKSKSEIRVKASNLVNPKRCWGSKREEREFELFVGRVRHRIQVPLKREL